jgi:2-polyprenyl-3-methyl-5-hydroxy-6-metoxy-1,4-benzoquinol methylase
MRTYQSINELTEDIKTYEHGIDGKYMDDMVHYFPDTEIINREQFILSKCVDKIVLDIGCVGKLHLKIQNIAKKAYGWDRIQCKTPNFTLFDVERDKWNINIRHNFQPDLDLILCAEFMEHLLNPGLFLMRLKNMFNDIPVIFTVPNAFSQSKYAFMMKGYENVNDEHVAWYSWRTFSNLLKKCGYKIQEFYWWDDPKCIMKHGFNEGLVFIAK